jgi:hypothetical protein
METSVKSLIAPGLTLHVRIAENVPATPNSACVTTPGSTLVVQPPTVMKQVSWLVMAVVLANTIQYLITIILLVIVIPDISEVHAKRFVNTVLARLLISLKVPTVLVTNATLD